MVQTASTGGADSVVTGTGSSSSDAWACATP